MKNKKIKVGLIFGGKSGEHEVSLASAYSIYKSLNKNKYKIVPIGIDKKGVWRVNENQNEKNSKSKLSIGKKDSPIVLINLKNRVALLGINSNEIYSYIDVFFPITHGTFGEDGCLQGILEILEVPYVGPGVLGSAVGMDKDIMKRLFRESKILTADFFTLKKEELGNKKIKKIIRRLKFPIFVKPANLGSSVGISKAKNEKELKKAIKEAFQYDVKIILEKNISGREIECGVLGNENPIASIPGEIKLKNDFYSYNAKYIDEDSAKPVPRANLSKKMIKLIQEKSIKAFKIIGCEGMARVDFFLCKNGKLYINEINTLPGFTSISMYPKMFSESGIPYPKLLDKLIELAIERNKKIKLLKRSFV